MRVPNEQEELGGTSLLASSVSLGPGGYSTICALTPPLITKIIIHNYFFFDRTNLRQIHSKTDWQNMCIIARWLHVGLFYCINRIDTLRSICSYGVGGRMGQLLLKNDLFVLEPCFLGDISISLVGSTEVKPSFFMFFPSFNSWLKQLKPTF